MIFENKELSKKLLKAGFTNNKFSCYYEYVGNCKDSKIRIGIHFYGFPPKSEYRFSVNKIGYYIGSQTAYTKERCVLYLTEEELIYMLKHFGLAIECPGETNKLEEALRAMIHKYNQEVEHHKYIRVAYAGNLKCLSAAVNKLTDAKLELRFYKSLNLWQRIINKKYDKRMWNQSDRFAEAPELRAECEFKSIERDIAKKFHNRISEIKGLGLTMKGDGNGIMDCSEQTKTDKNNESDISAER